MDAQTERMQAALAPVLRIGPGFLAGRRDADDMAYTMVRAVEEYAKGERERQSDAGPSDAPAPVTEAARKLQAALSEVYGCGSGYLAGRCDAACVARTMTWMMSELTDQPSAG